LFESGASAVPTGWEVVDAPLPTAGRGEVRVRMLTSGLEYTDVVIRRHLYPQMMRRRPPFVLGYDVVGEIDQLGDGVRGFQLGDRVADLTVLGSNAAYRTLRPSDLTRVPAGVDAAEAAALISSWTTAYQLLYRAARVQRGQRVLVHGAAGAVGQSLLVLGRLARPPAVGHRARRSRGADPRARRHADRLPTRRLRARSCRAGSMSSSTTSARTTIAARSRRSSAAACYAPTATRRACRRSVTCSPF
jgi:NADPH:quinone reductase-like Zn-dependent oxidoreductase